MSVKFAIVKMKTKWTSLALVVKIDKVLMYALDETCTDLLYFWGNFLEFFERHVPHGR